MTGASPGAPGLAAEEDLVHAAAEGDGVAFRAIYDRYARGLLAFVASRLGDRSRAEDVVQDVFLVLLRRGASYRARAPLGAFLYRVARNRAANVHRDAKPQAPVADRAIDPPPLAAVLDVRRALERLPEVFREPIRLATYGDLGYEEIARVLDCPIGTVRSRISRGKRLMAEMLEPRR